MANVVERLLTLAEELVARADRSSALKRRAVSSGYYAVFHSVARIVADRLIGGALSDPLYERVCRAVDHGALKNAFTRPPLKDDEELRRIGGMITLLRSARWKADCSPPVRDLFTRPEAQELIALARLAVEDLRGLRPSERRTLAAALMFRERAE